MLRLGCSLLWSLVLARRMHYPQSKHNRLQKDCDEWQRRHTELHRYDRKTIEEKEKANAKLASEHIKAQQNLDWANQQLVMTRSNTGHVYTIYMSNMILLYHAYVTIIYNVPVRSTVLHAYLNPLIHTHTMSPEDTIRDYYIFKCYLT